jgi:hypothetical protein
MGSLPVHACSARLAGTRLVGLAPAQLARLTQLHWLVLTIVVSLLPLPVMDCVAGPSQLVACVLCERKARLYEQPNVPFLDPCMLSEAPTE